jgi:hypothetical protein
MSQQMEDLSALMLNLPAEDRAQLLERLLASFDPKSTAQTAWLQLAQQRRDEVRVGTAVLAPGAEALARVKARLP